MLVRRLEPPDAADFQALRLRGLREDATAFGSSYEEEKDRSLESVAARLDGQGGQAVLGAFVDGRLVGVAGLGREAMRNLAHKAFVWGLYVAPERRGLGIARALMMQVLSLARGSQVLRQVNLCVNARNEAARRLYESLGFEVWGHERGSMIVQGELQDEFHMVLPLTAAQTQA